MGLLKEDVEILRSLRGNPFPEGSILGGEYESTGPSRPCTRLPAQQGRPMPKQTPEKILGMWVGGAARGGHLPQTDWFSAPPGRQCQ